MYAPKDTDHGALLFNKPLHTVVEVDEEPAVEELKPVPGKPHLFVDIKGRLSYAPPGSQSSGGRKVQGSRQGVAMKEEVAKAWVEALRSGKYQQGRLRLRRGESYCCLGVLCDISGLGVWTPLFDRMRYLGVVSSLPYQVMAWSEVSTSAHEMLVLLNDSGASFEQIAQHIEQYWREL